MQMTSKLVGRRAEPQPESGEWVHFTQMIRGPVGEEAAEDCPK